MGEGVLAVLANRTNQAILSILAVEPSYPRRIGALLSLSEAEVARRLKQMEGAGLVSSAWSYIGKNVKLYKLETTGVGLRLTPEGLRVELARSDGAPVEQALVNPLAMKIPRPAEFVGRARELAVLQGPEQVVLVQGMPGIGKTSLLARFAQDQPPRAVFWHSFRGVESLNWLSNRLAVFLAQHGDRALLEAVERGAELADRRELMLQSFDREGRVYILDDVHAVEDEAVRSFLQDAAQRALRCKLVLASRELLRLSTPRVRVLHLGGLDDEEVRRFLELKQVPFAPADLPALRAQLGGHPLALNLFLEAAREQGVPAGELLGKLPPRNIEEYLLNEVYEKLGEDEREVLAHASVFRTRFSLEDLQAVSRKTPEAGLLKLRRRLLVASYDGEYGLHEIIRTFFYALLKNKRELHDKAAAHHLAEGSIEGRLEAMHHLLAAGRRDRVLELLEQNLDLREFDFIDAGYQGLYLWVLELFPREEVHDPRRWALIQDEKGDIRLLMGDLERSLALHAEAAALFAGAGDAGRVADLAWKRAMALAKLGRQAEALALCEEGLAAAPEDGVARPRLEELRGALRGGGKGPRRGGQKN